MYLKTLALAVVGVASVSGFAPSAVPALRPAETATNMLKPGPPTWRKTNPNNGFYQTPYDPKTTQNFNLKDALGLEEGPVDTTYQKPASSFNFGNKPAAKAAAKPAARAAPAKPAAGNRAGSVGGRMGSVMGRIGSIRK